MHGVNEYAYGLWIAVISNIFIFAVFGYSAFRPATRRDWRTFGAFIAFIVALFSEMFGLPLTIYILTSILGNRYPVLDPFSHASGHLWITFAGGSTVLYSILHPLSNILIFSGLIVIAIGWRGIYYGRGELVTNGIYRFIRHPQYCGFALMIIGFLIQWPTIITIVMAPVLLLMYAKLAKKEEKKMIDLFGERYIEYCKQVPAFIPIRIIKNRVR